MAQPRASAKIKVPCNTVNQISCGLCYNKVEVDILQDDQKFKYFSSVSPLMNESSGTKS